MSQLEHDLQESREKSQDLITEERYKASNENQSLQRKMNVSRRCVRVRVCVRVCVCMHACVLV